MHTAIRVRLALIHVVGKGFLPLLVVVLLCFVRHIVSRLVGGVDQACVTARIVVVV